MTTPVAHRGILKSLIYPALRPVYYPARYYYHLLRVRTAGLNVSAPRSISMDCSHEEMARRIRDTISPGVQFAASPTRSMPAVMMPPPCKND
jgi:hypothetical protein